MLIDDDAQTTVLINDNMLINDGAQPTVKSARSCQRSEASVNDVTE